MLELSDHILDISANSIRAGAKLVEIIIDENTRQDTLIIKINDDGSGLKEEEIEKAKDPFYTTKKVRRVGLGLPLFIKAAEMSGGNVQVESEEGKSTKVTAKFCLSSLDRQPIGDIVKIIVVLIAGSSDVDFYFKQRCDEKFFEFDTRLIRNELGDVSLNHPEILKYIRSVLREGIESVNSKA